jgi:Zn-dependent protease with chaperone function
MTASIASPLVAATLLAIAATSVHRWLPPRLASRFVTTALVLVAIAALPTLLIVAVAFLAHAPVVGLGFEWCARAFGLHEAVPAWIGLPIVLIIGWGAVRTSRVVREHRRLRIDVRRPVYVADSVTPYAVTLPGRAGQIIVSTALLDGLDESERRVVIAHERAHARYRHDRYVLVAALCAAALPPLRTLSNRVTYSIERWADEAAAAVCGDRRLVAVTLGKVALHRQPATVSGFAGLGVASRMGALLEPPVGNPRRPLVIAMWSAVVMTAGLSLYQLHHVERLLTALCPH